MQKKFITYSKGIAHSRNVAEYLNGQLSYKGELCESDQLITWGRKIKPEKIESIRDLHDKDLLRLEDGFISYRLHPALDDYRLSLIVDKTGIYYDSSRPNDLETIIFKRSHDFNEKLRQRSQNLRNLLVSHNISKYNLNQKSAGEFFKAFKNKTCILLVDQTAGDRSVFYAKANAQTYTDMVKAAKREHPQAQLFALTHPDVILGKKKGYLYSSMPDDIIFIPSDLNAMSVLNHIDHVYTVSSQLGFEALLRAKKVSVFGHAFYGGWGLTDDRVVYERKRCKVDIDQLVHSCLIDYPLYRLPYLKRMAEIEEVIEYILTSPYRDLGRFNKIYCKNFSMWKKIFVARYLKPHSNQLKFVKKIPSDIKSDDALLVWGYKEHFQNESSFTVLKMEDGFIRSVGLGSDLKLPSSIVIEKQALYYDAAQTSTLETILETRHFSKHTQERSTKLIHSLRHKAITKYNVQNTQSISVPSEKHVCLVVGQVAGDAAIQHSGSEVRTDEQLLERVRRDFPDAFILYKPHPDVLAKNRSQKKVQAKLYDKIITTQDIISCFKVANSVHLISSLAGFEALIHEKIVYTYGLPFYAGWGLTVDALTCSRRTRRLSLNDLVAGCLIAYPRYYNWKRGRLSDLEDIIDDICIAKKSVKSESPGSYQVPRILIKLRYFFQSIVDHYL